MEDKFVDSIIYAERTQKIDKLISDLKEEYGGLLDGFFSKLGGNVYGYAEAKDDDWFNWGLSQFEELCKSHAMEIELSNEARAILEKAKNETDESKQIEYICASILKSNETHNSALDTLTGVLAYNTKGDS